AEERAAEQAHARLEAEERAERLVREHELAIAEAAQAREEAEAQAEILAVQMARIQSEQDDEPSDQPAEQSGADDAPVADAEGPSLDAVPLGTLALPGPDEDASSADALVSKTTLLAAQVSSILQRMQSSTATPAPAQPAAPATADPQDDGATPISGPISGPIPGPTPDNLEQGHHEQGEVETDHPEQNEVEAEHPEAGTDSEGVARPLAPGSLLAMWHAGSTAHAETPLPASDVPEHEDTEPEVTEPGDTEPGDTEPGPHLEVETTGMGAASDDANLEPADEAADHDIETDDSIGEFDAETEHEFEPEFDEAAPEPEFVGPESDAAEADATESGWAESEWADGGADGGEAEPATLVQPITEPETGPEDDYRVEADEPAQVAASEVVDDETQTHPADEVPAEVPAQAPAASTPKRVGYHSKRGTDVLSPLFLLAAIGFAAVVGRLAWKDKLWDDPAWTATACLLTLICIIVSLRNNTSSRSVSIDDQGVLKVTLGESSSRFDLTKASTRIEQTGTAGHSDWRLTIPRRGLSAITIDPKMVDSTTFMEAVRQWKPELK
ncbi:MAG: hypothetical protein L0H31_06370, partial [Nocardioidaceae bacterium]|nr:hypothetical protein [Nocardioidaceae bacterium]